MSRIPQDQEATGRINLAQRRKARKLIMQALYQWQMSGGETYEIEAQFREEAGGKVDWEYFHDVFTTVVKESGKFDALIEPLLDRELRFLDPVERALLRMGACELSYRIDVPYRVVINECVELAKSFGAAESHKYINGVLDRLAKSSRVVEQSAGRRPH